MSKWSMCLSLIGVCTLALVLGGVSYTYNRQTNMDQNDPMTISTADGAIVAIQRSHPELAEYPSNKLPPRSIVVEESADTWHIAFVQNGSGINFLGATCFSVSRTDGSIQQTGTYSRAEDGSEEEKAFFSAKSCAVVGSEVGIVKRAP